MKLTVNTKSFTDAIDWVLKLYGRGNADGSSYVCLVVNKKGEGHLYHPNTVSYMKAPFVVMESDLEEDTDGFALALDGRVLKGLMGALNSSKDDVVLSTDKPADKGPSLGVKSTNGSFTVPSVSVRPTQEPKLHNIGMVNDQDFLGTLQRLSKLCDSVYASTVPAIGAVDLAFDFENKKLVFMGTDRYALAEASVEFNPLGEAAPEEFALDHVLIPMDVASVVGPSRDGMEEISLVYEKVGKKFGYNLPNGKVALFALTDAAPIPYQSAKERMLDLASHSLQFSKNELKKAISTISALTLDDHRVAFSVNADTLTVSDPNEANSITVTAEDNSRGSEEEFRTGMMTSVINEGLIPITSASLNIKWAKNDPKFFIIESVLDDGETDPNLFVMVARINLD